ncbi:MAG: hypothetical protein ACI84D_000769, partial [Thalassolituus oleivorans]
CYKCHGPDNNTRVQGIRFDTPEGIRASRRHIARRILSKDPEEHMPPPESNLTLSAQEKAVLLKWVDQGAEYQPHWAFQAPERPLVPSPLVAHRAGMGSGLFEGAVDLAAWPTGPVDQFVLSSLQTAGLEPSEPASPETWLRRVTFTLTGLPPTPEDILAFVSDSGPLARRTVVNGLMDSPAFGERMAVDWLDLARYADSHGYQDDGWRNMWPWRDWVISAFNRNLPFDEFVTWQLAGDLLPEPTREQILATGFNRNHLQSQEGGIVLEEYRVDYVADRTDTFGKAFLGLTTECSRCHDHKYDPITQDEYYGLFGFFNSVNEVGNIPYAGEASPTVLLVDSLSQAQLDRVQLEIARLETEIDPDHPAYDAEFEAWAETRPQGTASPQALEPAGLIAHFPLEGFRTEKDILRFDDAASPGASGYFWGDRDKVPHVVEGVADSALVLRGDGWLDTGNERFRFERSDPFSLDIWVRLDSANAVGPLFGKSGGLFNGNRGYLAVINPDRTLTMGLYHVLPDDALEITTRDSLVVGAWQRVTMTYDGSSRAAGLKAYLGGALAETRVVVDNLHQSIAYTVDPFTKDSSNWGDPGNLRVGFVESNQPTLAGATVDEFKVFGRALTAAEISGRAPDAADLRAFFVTTQSPTYKARFSDLTTVRARENSILTKVPSVMVMADMRVPRPTYVLQRGAYDQPTRLVERGTPAAILPFPDDLEPNRLGLAEWLFREDNPLTARVAINRLWQQVFGAGVVSTASNFGSQGAMPTHPELLDWLAVEFRESGWDVRHMLRLMVLSSTFAQSSVVGEDARLRDPDNRLLARGPARRLSAEMLRDQALAAAGLLVPTVGGPPVKPYQPDGLWAALATRNGVLYKEDSGDALHRRSMYTLWKRTVPPPMMMTFDASERNLCTIQRQSTSTPLQALILLNDPQFVEASRVLAERMIREGGPSREARITRGFLLLTGRAPSEVESDALSDLATAQMADFRAKPGDARRLLEVGRYPRDRGLDAAEVAAYTVVASTIMNFDAATMLR